MRYFIPAWYNNGNWWEDKTAPFYSRRLVKEFDDAISLMNMHVKSKEDFKLLILNYYPDLRLFLHTHDLYETNYWSLFDDIQGFTHKTPQPIDYSELNWPDGTEFIYSPYLIRAVTSESTYSNIYFNPYGYMIWIEDFEQQQRTKRYIFDDRGFLSTILFFDENGTAMTQEFMTSDGDTILTLHLINGSVIVSDKYKQRFNQQHYESMEALLTEKVESYEAMHMKQSDNIIIAADTRHNQMLSQIFKSYALCFSIFKNRNLPLTNEQLKTIEQSSYWLVDMLDNEETLKNYKNEHHLDTHIMRITPFDTEVLPNISSQLYETYIGLWVDGLDEARLKQAFSQIVSYMQQEDQLRLVLLTEKEKSKLPTWLSEQVQAINDQHNSLGVDPDGAELLLAEEEDYVEIIQVKYVPFESDLIEAISTLRIIVDLNNEPDLFLQICSISAGLPQINMRTTDYVNHEVNGLVLNSVEDINQGLDYFLSHLKHWNYSYAYSIKLVDTFASKNIIQRLNQWFEGEINET